MNIENYISLNDLCEHYGVSIEFIYALQETELIEVSNIDQSTYIHHDIISDLEKILRLHDELGVNIEGIDTIFNLLQKIDSLQNELKEVKNRLRIYEDG